MKKNLFYLASAITLGFAMTSCGKDPVEPADIPVKGEINMAATYFIYSHGNQGWTKEDKVGVYVLSDGRPQNNFVYIPADTAKYKEKSLGGKTYIMYDKNPNANKDVMLLPANTNFKVGFKEGEHTIYAYVPYDVKSEDVKNVCLPNLAIQEQNAKEFMPFRKYTFAYASGKMSQYSSASLSLGEMKTPFSQITLAALNCPATLSGKTCTEVEISCEQPIAFKDGATINLTNGEIKGEAINKVVYKIPEGLQIVSRREKTFMMPAYVMIAAPVEKAATYSYTVTITVDGKKYSTTTSATQFPHTNNLILKNMEVVTPV